MPKVVYKLKAYIRSFTDPDKKYTVKKKEDGTFSCSCPAWIFNHSGDRTCKHLHAIFTYGDAVEKIFMYGNKHVLDIDGKQWEVLPDVSPDGGKK